MQRHDEEESRIMVAPLQIVAIDQQGIREEITNLCWFEEHGCSDWSGNGSTGQYVFEIYINETLAWHSQQDVEEARAAAKMRAMLGLDSTGLL
jgi:hypothetical protein